jgi:hypothetical protein
MNTLPLRFKGGHLFVDVDGKSWLLDTGAPTSFGSVAMLSLCGVEFSLPSAYLGLTADTLAGFVGEGCVGLLGGDVLGGFDMILDVPGNLLAVSSGELAHEGRAVCMEWFMGIPVVTARVDGKDHRMFFDTGAQVSYLQDGSLARHPATGRIADFYPGFGRFETDTHEVPVTLGGVGFRVRCGTLPGLLGMTLMLAGTTGILGNEIVRERVVGYFPRRRTVVL